MLVMCTSCDVAKPPTDFYVRGTDPQKGQRFTSCKSCCRARRAATYATDPTYRAAVATSNRRTAPAARVRRKANPQHVFADRVRESLSHALHKRGYVKGGKTFSLLGYTPDELRAHLMTYVGKLCQRCRETIIVLSRSGQHIDHIIPIHTAVTRDGIITLNALSNLRLLCPTYNLSKQGRIE